MIQFHFHNILAFVILLEKLSFLLIFQLEEEKRKKKEEAAKKKEEQEVSGWVVSDYFKSFL